MSATASEYQVVVIGGGAAGIFAAINAARWQPSWKVLVLEKSGKLLSKVKVSGGGRCNVTHACFDKKELPSYYPRGASLVRRYVHRFFTTDTINWFSERGVTLKQEEDGRMFPVTDDSQTIIDALLREASRYQVEFRFQADVCGVKKIGDQFSIQLSDGRNIKALHCCIAAGGMAKASSFDWIQEMGHALVAPVPSLFTFNAPGHPLTKLMGISLPQVRVRVSGTKLEQTGPVLITHWGLSGPAILRLSAWGAQLLQKKNYQFSVQLNWIEGEGWSSSELPAYFDKQRQEHPTQQIINSHMFQMPQRLWEYFLSEAGIENRVRFSELKSKEENKLIKLLTDMVIEVSGKTTFKEEFVTAGGVDCTQIDPLTMESKIIPHLYFAGEVMDVDGLTGGFNFQHAWSSGYLAALSMTGATDS